MAFENSAFTAPSVNTQAVARYLSPTILQNVVQNLFHRPGRGLDQRVELGDNLYEVRVIRQLPLSQKSRRLGATNDGGWFSSQTAEQPSSQEYGIRINITLDTPLVVATHAQNLVPLDLLNSQSILYTQLLMLHINASTIAAQLAANFNYNAQEVAAARTATFVQFISGTDSLLQKVFDAGAVLDDGDATNGIHTFPAEGRIALWRASAKREFFNGTQTVLSLGNWKAQDLVEMGVVEYGVTRNTIDDGYFGHLDGVAHMMVSKPVWDLAEEYLVQSGAYMAAGTLDEVIGLVAHSYSTVRGIAMQNFIKVVDAQEGAGYKLQPAPRWGIEVFYPRGIVVVTTDSFTNPAYPASVYTPITIDATNAIA